VTRWQPAIYRPRHVVETMRVQGKLISCGESSLAMLIDAVTLGGVRVSQQWVRARSSEPIPDPRSPGLNLPQLIAVARDYANITLSDRTGDTFTELRAYLSERRKLIVQLDNWELSDCGRSRVGHAIFLQSYNADRHEILGNNPLCDRAKWYDAERIKDAMQKFARDTGVRHGLRFAVSARVPRVAVVKS
jgi:hypothetical protein